MSIKGTNISGATPSAGQALTWDGTQWAPASAGGGITQLTGDVTAGPGSGSQASAVHAISGNAGGVLGETQIPVPNKAYFQSVGGKVPFEWNFDDNVVRMGTLEPGGYGAFSAAEVRPTDVASIGVINSAFSYRAARKAVYQALSVFDGGMQQIRHARVTSGTYVLDGNLLAATDYYVESAFAVGSGGITVEMPTTPWSISAPNTPGRTFVVADVLGTCSVADPIVLTDPTGRTFNGVAGPYTISLPSNTATIVLDSTLTNWILSFQSGVPV